MSAVRLEDNVANRTLSAEQPKFKIWSSAGLMLSYWCPAQCACCYVYSGPHVGGDSTEMSVELAVACWRSVRALAGERGKVHITGGEPFGDYERLRTVLQIACQERLGGLEKVETNAYWCTDEQLVRARLSELKSLGLSKLQVSTDVYHQEYIPIERVRLAVQVAREILGDSGVQVRWRDFLVRPVLVAGKDGAHRAAAFAKALRRRKERMLGRAAVELVSLFPLRDYKYFAETNCSRSLLGARHVHIDGVGNVFCGTCIGIVAGRAGSNKETSLEELWRDFDYRKHPIFSILAEKGPTELLVQAQKMGYRPKAGYADKCHICYDVRRFLYERNQFHRFLGPGVCYGQGSAGSAEPKGR